jgi:hypothetical protein
MSTPRPQPDVHDDPGKEPTALPYGRYAGQPIEDVPTVELRWLLAFDVEGDDLREAIRQCLIARGMAQ